MARSKFVTLRPRKASRQDEMECRCATRDNFNGGIQTLVHSVISWGDMNPGTIWCPSICWVESLGDGGVKGFPKKVQRRMWSDKKKLDRSASLRWRRVIHWWSVAMPSLPKVKALAKNILHSQAIACPCARNAGRALIGSAGPQRGSCASRNAGLKPKSAML